MTDAYVLAHVLPAAFALLPPTMDTPAARAMLLSIGLQESKFTHRLQLGGPARGFWQFERGGGVAGVLTHVRTASLAANACRALNYPAAAPVVYQAIADNDTLACVFARLLLWTLPVPLAPRGASTRGWEQYLQAWRPGKPHLGTWPGYFARAWTVVEPE